LLDMCLRGDLTVWVVERNKKIIAAVLTEVKKTPKRKFLSIPWVGGSHMRDWLDPILEIFSSYGKSVGCDSMTGEGRKGWCRVAGFKPLTTVFIKELAHE
jgi:hypothetical protein